MMKRFLGGVIGLALFAACNPASSPPQLAPDAAPDASLPPGPPQPSPPSTPTARLCDARFTVTGTFTASAARPADNQDGCWPVGTWKFSLALVPGSDTCNPAPAPLAGGYEFVGDLEPDPNDPSGPPIETFTYETDPTVMNAVKVTEGGSGSCAGELDLYSPDCTKVWELQPETDTTAATTTISGQAEYSEFNTSICD